MASFDTSNTQRAPSSSVAYDRLKSVLQNAVPSMQHTEAHDAADALMQHITELEEELTQVKHEAERQRMLNAELAEEAASQKSSASAASQAAHDSYTSLTTLESYKRDNARLLQVLADCAANTSYYGLLVDANDTPGGTSYCPRFHSMHRCTISASTYAELAQTSARYAPQPPVQPDGENERHNWVPTRVQHSIKGFLHNHQVHATDQAINDLVHEVNDTFKAREKEKIKRAKASMKSQAQASERWAMSQSSLNQVLCSQELDRIRMRLKKLEAKAHVSKREARNLLSETSSVMEQVLDRSQHKMKQLMLENADRTRSAS